MRSEYFNHWEPVQRELGYSQAVRIGDLVFIAGTAAVDAQFAPVHAGDFPAQLRFVYDRLRETLAQFSLDFRHVVREVLYATDMRAMVDAMPIRKAVYGDGPFPAATGVEVKQLLFPELLIEIELIAAIPH
jgi:2-iminobutanoate/2-iminopropanoate deaminase